MTEEERKMLAFLVKIVREIILYGTENISTNDWQQLDNIADELRVYDLDPREFRW